MSEGRFGINLSFAVKRWPEPHAWGRLVREVLGLDVVQFTFDLLDPGWPEVERGNLARAVRQASAEFGIEIHSAFVGLANYTYNGLLHPLAAGRSAALEWWRRAVFLAAELGARAVGGPLGGMSVTDAHNESSRQACYDQLVQATQQICSWAKEAGLNQLLIEPTPLVREFPYTVAQAEKLLHDLGQNTGVPVRYVIDVGHALYQPLYGTHAALVPWFEALGEHIGLIHLQNTDFQSDSHWGWPHEHGRFDVAEFARLLHQHHLSHTPIFLEVFYPFELADEAVLDNITHSVQHCRAQLTRA